MSGPGPALARLAASIANKVTGASGLRFQCEVSYEKMTSVDAGGAKTYASAVTLPAIVEKKQRQVRTVGGVLDVSSSTVMFLDLDKLATATGGGGISVHDKITLPDGTTGPVLNLGGFMDSGNNRLIPTEVYLG